MVPAAALGDLGYLFVFHRGGVTASVFDAETLQPLAAPVVGRGAFAAFAVPHRGATARAAASLTISTTPVEALSCTRNVLTDANGAAGISCTAFHADFTLVTPLQPALPNEIILLFLTGLGPTNPAVGTNVPGPAPPARSIVDPVVAIDDTGAEVLGSFYAPGLVTAYQVNFRIPANTQPGNRKLSFVAAGARAVEVVIPVGR